MIRIAGLVLSCEHGGNRLPKAYADLGHGYARLLRSHRGLDVGALSLARTLARRLGVPLYAHTISRLLVDANRSRHHSKLFSELSCGLSSQQRQEIVVRYHRPHRGRVAAAVCRALARHGGPVLHLSIHSFVPRLFGHVRATDVGLLYDPQRPLEAALAAQLLGDLRLRLPTMRLRRNDPYRGRADGLTTALRRHFGADAYVGMELEMNQRHARSAGAAAVATALCTALAATRADFL